MFLASFANSERIGAALIPNKSAHKETQVI